MRNIKFQISNFKFQIKKTGFTLIELLIVIALLGALAVGLLATVDPFEQLKKGTDTSTRNTVSELYNSFIRYYSVKNAMPWTAAITAVTASSQNMADSSTGYIHSVVTAGELKTDFIQLAGGSLDSIYITSTLDSLNLLNNVAVCFAPKSKSFANDTNAKYNNDASPGTSCKGTGGTADCFWCIK
ncbi:prepilin-type N-terminal cleavage/methylation domain-containing protein [Candidatus Gottesmanbacteria bacterium]|nr:prepilin-type N-terminal cleavage/methylation domain-containing protein [Candidatus Gottesmanbacteria bacterium]